MVTILFKLSYHINKWTKKTAREEIEKYLGHKKREGFDRKT